MQGCELRTFRVRNVGYQSNNKYSFKNIYNKSLLESNFFE